MQEKQYIKCNRCGIAELSETLIDGVCEECRDLRKRQIVTGVSTHANNENPYLLLGLVEFAILSTLMVVFFPWSLLFCVVFFGLEETKFIILALLHYFVKTVLVVLSILVPIVIGVLAIIFS